MLIVPSEGRSGAYRIVGADFDETTDRDGLEVRYCNEGTTAFDLPIGRRRCQAGSSRFSVGRTSAKNGFCT
jgi:hypothetical protein